MAGSGTTVVLLVGILLCLCRSGSSGGGGGELGFIPSECLRVPATEFVGSVKSTLDAVKDVASAVAKFANVFGDFRLATAVSDCLDLLDLSADELSWTLDASQYPNIGKKDNSTGNLSDDLRTWLSAALINQDTCMEGFDGTNGFVKNMVSGGLNEVTSLIGDILGKVRPVSDGNTKPKSPISGGGKGSSGGHHPGGSRKLLFSNDQLKFPDWLKPKDRKLLQSGGVAADAVVALDGSGSYSSIMDAVSAAPEFSSKRFVIYVKKGVYKEYVEIKKKKWNIMMIGDGMDVTVISGNRNFIDGWTTFRSATFAVKGRGFIARDITFENTAGPQKHQAVAFRSDSDLSQYDVVHQSPLSPPETFRTLVPSLSTMDTQLSNASNPQPSVTANMETSNVNSVPAQDGPSKLSTWAKSLKIPQPFTGSQEEENSGNAAKSTFARFTSGFGMLSSPKSPTDDNSEGTSTTPQSSFIGTFTKGLVDSSKNAVKAVSVKARHVVSQNKRRYQEGGFDLDLTYITENIIAMGFPAGDMSSGFFGYVEGFYRNHMEEVIKFFESHHKDKYKVYNLCSERLYDVSLFEGKVASFPFDDHNCPPIQLIMSFCQSAYSWLKEDIENVVVVHCKAGMARTGLMISSLLLYLKFFPTAEESINYYNQKRCMDAKGLVLPSQIRYVKYFERILMYFNGENQPARRCMLRGFRLHRCPYWIRPSITISDHNGVVFSTKKHPRTKDLLPEDYWFSAPKKGVVVFALPGEPGVAELAGDFKVHFNDRQGDFYCWLNTTMIENRKILNTSDLDGFDKRKLPSPGFQVEIVLVDYDTAFPTRPQPEVAVSSQSTDNSSTNPASGPSPHSADEPADANSNQKSGSSEKDDVFSDNEAEETGKPKVGKVTVASEGVQAKVSTSGNNAGSTQISSLTQKTQQVSLGDSGLKHSEQKRDTTVGAASVPEVSNTEVSDFKIMAADASVFTFGDEEDYESE